MAASIRSTSSRSFNYEGEQEIEHISGSTDFRVFPASGSEVDDTKVSEPTSYPSEISDLYTIRVEEEIEDSATGADEDRQIQYVSSMEESAESQMSPSLDINDRYSIECSDFRGGPTYYQIWNGVPKNDSNTVLTPTLVEELKEPDPSSGLVELTGSELQSFVVEDDTTVISPCDPLILNLDQDAENLKVQLDPLQVLVTDVAFEAISKSFADPTDSTTTSGVNRHKASIDFWEFRNAHQVLEEMTMTDVVCIGFSFQLKKLKPNFLFDSDFEDHVGSLNTLGDAFRSVDSSSSFVFDRGKKKIGG